jgi:hypothetical protein
VWWMISVATAGTGPTPGDVDGDGLPDAWEALLGTHVYAPDTDGDTVPDLYDVARAGPTSRDSDGDGLDDLQELRWGTHARRGDTDSDGLRDGDEVRLGADPHIRDTDADGIPDGGDAWEGLDPLCPGRWRLLGPTPEVVRWVVFDPDGSGGGTFESVLQSNGSRKFGFDFWHDEGAREDSRYGWRCPVGSVFCSSSALRQRVREVEPGASVLRWDDAYDGITYTTHLALGPGEAP